MVVVLVGHCLGVVYYVGNWKTTLKVLFHTPSFLKSLVLSAYFCWLMVTAVMHGENRSNQSDPFIFPLCTHLPAGSPTTVNKGVRCPLPYRSFFLGRNLHLIWLTGPALNFEP